MRRSALCLLASLACACGSTSGDVARTPGGVAAHADRRVRIVYRQYYRGSHVFVMENLAGRDVVELRSRPVPEGEVPVAYVPDEVMRRLLEVFEDAEFQRYAQARPPDPRRFAVAELTLVDEDRRMVSFLRRRRTAGMDVEAYKRESEAYLECVKAFRTVWDFHSPTLQATRNEEGFGAHRVER